MKKTIEDLPVMPCPFCGNAEVDVEVSSMNFGKVICPNCSVTGPVVFYNSVFGDAVARRSAVKKEAIKSWNRREPSTL